jgi:CubicO group peptidase (beta-lactamase class C family)
MTPLELADFTSGLPDDPTDLPKGPLSKRNIEHYTTKDFLTWVSSWTPETPLPAPYLYSNAGIGLLGYLVAQATGQLWEQRVNAAITTPLSMPDTLLRPNPEQMKRMAEGHTRNGQKAPPWPIYAWYAAGGLRSTARDMLHFGEANLGHSEVYGRPVSAELIAAMKLAQTPIYTLPSGKNKQAMAWVNNEGSGQPGVHTVIVKNGGTDGFEQRNRFGPLQRPYAVYRGKQKRQFSDGYRHRDRTPPAVSGSLLRFDLLPLFGGIQRANRLGHARGIKDLLDLLFG